MYFSLAVLDNEFRLLPSCLRFLWVCCLDGSHGLLPEDLLPIAYLGYYFFYYFLLCTIIWNIQIKIAFWNFDVFLLAVLDNEFRLLLLCLRCLWVCCLDGSHGLLPEDLLPIAYLGCYFFKCIYILLCTIICLNIQIKITFWNFDVFFARGIGQWVPASPIVLTLPVGLLPSWVSCLRISFLSRLSQILRLRN